ncbi:hypothetical protein A167_03119 [Alcanivorax sp. S71-1-4]|nr:hypothetical protein A167_03119 [Alcanivorax sp. S71-1-4]
MIMLLLVVSSLFWFRQAMLEGGNTSLLTKSLNAGGEIKSDIEEVEFMEESNVNLESIGVSEVRFHEDGPEKDRIHNSPARYDFSAIALFETHDKDIASAVVLVDGYGAYRYGIGQVVIDEYYIKNIHSDHVVISGREGDFRVYMAPLSGEDADEPSVVSAGVRGGDILSDTKDIRERMRIFSTYDIYPVSEGSAAGYVIGERFSPQMLEATGAKPGDIIVSVNGYNVGAQEGDDLALKSFRTTMKASVLIRRSDGTSFYFNYPEDADDP